jgi:bifunctional N-acetylglucosamine-1-phosphate-uridyltransferase/glucosamine-1-phosphate-acetyltransferase GlmU-like protein
MRAMSLRPYLHHLPVLGERVYVDPAASVIGDVVLGDDASVWPGTVIRGDVNFIRIGARTNLQDGTVVHVSHDGPHAKLGGFATVIGSDVTIGHKAIVHACRIEDAVLIGMGAIVLDWRGRRETRLRRARGAGHAGQGRRQRRDVLWAIRRAACAPCPTRRSKRCITRGHYVRSRNQYLAARA